MKSSFYPTLIFVFSLSVALSAQNTVGLLSYDPSQAFDGYNLLYPHNQPNVYLLDNCGEIVHTWPDEANWRPGNTAYLLPNSNLVKTKRDAVVINDPIWAGGGGGIIEIRDWDNNLIWEFEMNNDSMRLHHDICPIPNGNILVIAWEKKTWQQAIDAGRDSSLIPDGEVWSEAIFEIDPDTDEFVWEWHLWDHLIQDYDPNMANYGVVSDHPELLNINYTTNNGGADWLHSNRIAYNPSLGQIILSTPFLSEIYILDHTTSTQQAAGHFGGLGQLGGDFMYRWGNPAVYDRGTEADQKLFSTHDAHWADEFLDFSDPNFGKIVLYNNQAGPNFSTVNIINPPWDMYKWSYGFSGNIFGPTNFDWTYTSPDPETMYSTGLSSIQLQPNGNALICVGRQGYTFEITPEQEIVWEYETPLVGGNPATQGQMLTINQNLTFRQYRYPAYYMAFVGKDLSQKGWIELEPDSTFCDFIVPVVEAPRQYQLRLYPNPASNMTTVEWDGGFYVDLEVFDVTGRKMQHMKLSGGRKYLNTAKWATGVYFLRIGGVETRKLVVWH